MAVIKLITKPPISEKPNKSICIKTPMNDELTTNLYRLGKLGLTLLSVKIRPNQIFFEFLEGFIKFQFPEPQVVYATTTSGGFQEQARIEALYLVTGEPTTPIIRNRNPTVDLRGTEGFEIEFKSMQKVTTAVLLAHSGHFNLSTSQYICDRIYNEVDVTFQGSPARVTVELNGKTIFYDITD